LPSRSVDQRLVRVRRRGGHAEDNDWQLPGGIEKGVYEQLRIMFECIPICFSRRRWKFPVDSPGELITCNTTPGTLGSMSRVGSVELATSRSVKRGLSSPVFATQLRSSKFCREPFVRVFGTDDPYILFIRLKRTPEHLSRQLGDRKSRTSTPHRVTFPHSALVPTSTSSFGRSGGTLMDHRRRGTRKFEVSRALSVVDARTKPFAVEESPGD